MRRMHVGLTTIVVATAVLSAMLSARIGEAGVPAVEPQVDQTSEVFRLYASGMPGECVVSTGEFGMVAKRPLDVGAGCAGVHAKLSSATHWLDRDDGSVAFVDSDGGIVVEFSVSDGAAFESYQPAQPMMVLKAGG